jgi:halocyanin-like protein
MVDRRTVLRATAAAGAAAVGGSALSGTASAQESGFASWFSNVGNYDGVVEETGKSEVTIEVGAEANGGQFGFGPAAVRVDPGTTVTWKWVGGTHNVVADNGSYESETTGEQGFTFSQTFEEEGVSKYYCVPHETMGMKGAIVVGDVEVDDSPAGNSSQSGESGEQQSVDFGGWFENVDNFDGVVDQTGKSEVTVEVGAEANGGQYGFGPAAIRVDPGTKVTWEWVGGTHNVVADDGSFESAMQSEQGATFSQTFEGEGVSKYYCVPHEQMGMKGAVVVGSGGGGSGGSGGGALSTTDIGVLAFAGALVGGLLSPFALKAASSSSKQTGRNGPQTRRN